MMSCHSNENVVFDSQREVGASQRTRLPVPGRSPPARSDGGYAPGMGIIADSQALRTAAGSFGILVARTTDRHAVLQSDARKAGKKRPAAWAAG